MHNGNGPLVSIGMPFRNPGSLLVGAIRSVFAQTLEDWELILVNDGSRDGCAELAASIVDQRVRFFDDGKALGLVARLNQIIDLSRGQYIARMDADDLMHPRRLETQLAFMEERPDIQVTDTGAVVLGGNRRPIGIRGLQGTSAPSVVEALKWGVVLHPSVVARGEWYRANRYDQAFVRAEDRELFLRSFDPDVFAHIPFPLYFYFCAGNVRKGAFLHGYRSERRVLLRYGPRLVGWPLTGVLWMRSLAKALALPVLLALGKGEIVIRKAHQPIGATAMREALDVMAKIQEQSVPGWQGNPYLMGRELTIQ